MPDTRGVTRPRIAPVIAASVVMLTAGAGTALAGTPGAACEARAVAFAAEDTGLFTWRLSRSLTYYASAKVQVRRTGDAGEFITLASTPVASAGTRTQQAGIGDPRLEAGAWDWRMFLTEWDGTTFSCDGPAFQVTRLPAPGIAFTGPGITGDGWRSIGDDQVVSVTPGPGDASVGATARVRFQYSGRWWSSTRSAPAEIPSREVTAVEAYRRTADGLTGATRTVALRRDSWAPTEPRPHAAAVSVGPSGATVLFTGSTDWASGVAGYQARVTGAERREAAWAPVQGLSVRVSPDAASGTLQIRACDRVGNCSDPAEVALRAAPAPAPAPGSGADEGASPVAPSPPARPAARQSARAGAAARSPRRAAAAPAITRLRPSSPRGGAGRVSVDLNRPAEVTFTFGGSTIAREWLGAGRTLVRLPAQSARRRGVLTAQPAAGASRGEAVTATATLPGGARRRESARRRTTSMHPGARAVLYDLDAAVREVVEPLDGAAGLSHRTGALRQEPSTSGLFARDDDAARIAKVTEEDLRGLSAAQIADVLRGAIDGSDSHMVAFDELTPYEADPKGPVVKGGRIPPPDPTSPGAQLAQALIALDTPSPYGGTWASRVHVYIAPAVTSAMAAGRGPDRNLGRDGKARFRTYRTVMTGLARAGAVWIEMYHGITARPTPFTVAEWQRGPSAFRAEYRRAGGDPSRLHFLLTGTDRYPRGRLPAGCVTPQACQWELAESTSAGRAILANGVGGYRLGAQARPFLAEWQARVP